MRHDDIRVLPTRPAARPHPWISASLACVLREFMPVELEEDDRPHRHDDRCSCRLRGE
jgi:hypothetical protein